MTGEEWIADEAQHYRKIDTSALIQVPLNIHGQLMGIMFVHNASPRRWSQDEINFVKAVADRTYAALAKLRAEADRDIINEELSHRLKNTLAVVQAIASQTLRGNTDEAALKAFVDRLISLGKAHEFLLQGNWARARIVAAVKGALSLHALPGRLDIRGPDVNLGTKAVLSLTLLLHELATNATKYGALSLPGGHVAVVWSIDYLQQQQLLVLRWRERGGPPVEQPQRRGFGSRLIRMGLTGTGNATMTYAQEGLQAEFRAPLSAMTAEEGK